VRAYEVAAGIVWDGARLLITRRHAGGHQGGRWEFPGGKRHSGESLQDCLRRELLEEIGVEVEVGELWRALTHLYPDRHVSIYFLFCRILRGEPCELDVAGLRWIAPAELERLEFVEGDIPVLGDLVRDLNARQVRS
jgi:mutator protein MutT